MTLGQALKIAAVGAAAALLLALLLPVHLVLRAARPKWGRILPGFYWRAVLRMIGARVVIVGQPVPHRPLLLCANHVSWLDIPILISLMPLSFIAKAEVGTWPVIGMLAKVQNTIFIDRTRRTATAETNQVIAARLANGEALVLFPEGTSGDGNRVLPFRSSLLGGVREAIHRVDTDDEIHVQPVAICYRGYRGLPMGRHRRPLYAWYGDMTLAGSLVPVLSDGVIDVEIRFGDPLVFAAGTDRKVLTRALERSVRDMLLESLTGRARATIDA